MADLPQPYFDPSQYPGYLDAQRKQQVAQMLMSSLQTANQTPADWNSMKVVPKRGMLQNASVLADALMARKGMDASNAATSQYMQGLMGGAQPQQPPQGAPTGPGAGIISPNAPPDQQAAAQAVTNTPPGGLVPQGPAPQQPPQQNPMIPSGMTRQQATMISAMPGGMESLTKIMAGNFTPLEIQRQLNAAGIPPESPQGQMIQQAAIKKATTNLQEVKPGSTMYDVNQGAPVFTGPDQGVNTTWQGNNPTAAPIPGADTAAQGMAAAKTAGTQSQTPIKLGTDANGKDVYGFPTPPGPGRTAAGTGATNATAGGTTASPATVTSQESGAKAGQDYASELAKNATGATEVRRSISELKNLSTQATPGAANDAKAKLGAFMIAAGADPDNVAKWTGVDTGALQAAQKQTATLAVNSIHSMTSRGTNFDLDTFMKNNPNMNMADPAAFARVADYMNNKAGQDIAKQKDFANWKKTSGVTPDDWETQHTAHWLDQQNTAINQGRSNSAVPGVAPTNLNDLQAEARRRGLIK
jgi:hypothetical protein